MMKPMARGWCVAASVLLATSAVAWAGTGGIIRLPTAGTKVRSGLRIDIDTRWVDGTGYRPVRLRVASLPPGPAPADRSIEVTIRPNGWRMGRSRVSVTQTVELVQGAMFAEATVAIPHYERWSSFEIETREDGDRLRDLSVRHLGLPIRSYYNWSEATPAILVVDADAPGYLMGSTVRSASPNASNLPDIRGLASRIPLDSYNGVAVQELFNTSKPADDADILRLLLDVPRMEILPPRNLPTRWIDLTCVDIIVISWDELEGIVREMPSTWRAIRDWQACGATLCVYGVGEGYERLEALERRLAAQRLPVDPRRPYARGWTEPRTKRYTNAVKSLLTGEFNTYYSNQAAKAGRTVTEKLQPVPGPRRFLFREVRQGEVVALAADDPFSADAEQWSWVLNSLSQNRWMWYRRHGVSMHRENPEYWDLLIPGVGQAPVNSFLVLISLFVIVIGPVNYVVLRRQGRLYLILVTVPLGAVLVTASLLCYALLTDGLGVRLRTRSVTEIDQAGDHVVSWSRQSYYAGLSPAEGLSFPRDAAVYPVEHRPASLARRERNNHLVWDEGQRLASGFLPTRSTKQFLVVESRSSDAGLTVDETASPPRVVNRLGQPVASLLVKTSGGELYSASRIEAGASVRLQPIAADAAEQQWKERLLANRPTFPQDFSPFQLENAANFFGSYNYSAHTDHGLPKPSFKMSLSEMRLRDWTEKRFRNLQPRSYLATVTAPVEVSLGVPDASQEGGFHLVMGRW